VGRQLCLDRFEGDLLRTLVARRGYLLDPTGELSGRWTVSDTSQAYDASVVSTAFLVAAATRMQIVVAVRALGRSGLGHILPAQNGVGGGTCTFHLRPVVIEGGWQELGRPA
jgi:hypothetical protein